MTFAGQPDRRADGFTVAVVGAGGNNGSQVAPHVARLSGLRRVILIDPDSYELANLPHQDIERRDVGRAKVGVQARRMRRINGDVEVVAIRDRVEDVPLGVLAQSHVIIGCVDSLGARQWLNAAAWRAGRPLIDTGVLADLALARVTLIEPGQGRPCLVCGWHARHEQLLRLEYTCLGAATASTAAPTMLGALAAAHAVTVCKQLLTGESADAQPLRASLSGCELVIDAAKHEQRVTRLTYNPDCRFDHALWHLQALPTTPITCRVGPLFDQVTQRHDGNGCDNLQLRLEGKHFATALMCGACGRRQTVPPMLEHRAPSRRCRHCGQALTPVGFDMIDMVGRQTRPSVCRRTLKSLGFRTGDVATIDTPCGARRWLLTNDTDENDAPRPPHENGDAVTTGATFTAQEAAR